METKRCANPNCGKDLPLTDFNEGRSTCKYCDRKRAIEHRKKKSKIRRGLVTRYLGKVCVICGEKRMKLMRSHEKYGEPHPKLLDTPLDEIKKNCKSGRFVRVCAKCHGKAQDLLDKGIGWDYARFYIKEFMESDPPIETNAHLRAWHKWMRDNIRDRQLRLPIEVEEVPKVIEVPKVERTIFTSDKEAEQAFAGAEAII